MFLGPFLFMSSQRKVTRQFKISCREAQTTHYRTLKKRETRSLQDTLFKRLNALSLVIKL